MQTKIKKKLIIAFLSLVIVTVAIVVFIGYTYLLKPNVNTNKPNVEFYINTNDTFDDVILKLKNTGWLINIKTFIWVAQKMHYSKYVRPGRYIIKRNANNRELVSLLRSGMQTPVTVTFNNVRTEQDFAGVISKQIELDSLSIINKLQDEQFAYKYGFTIDNFRCMFIPNTYKVYWNISAEKLFNRFYREYKRFWTAGKLAKIESEGLTPIKVSILASIVEKESSTISEYPLIAGVYINRLKRGIPLQADPTVVFANHDFSIKRVLTKHLAIDSPYNTYKYRGLPPGPICFASIQAINSVVNYAKHRYLYFCAKDDFSGTHVFARTLRQHNQNAQRYRYALNHRRIYR